VLFGALRESSGGWGWPFALLGLCALVLMSGGYLASKPRMLEDSW
jgi:CP family cyanate transporter-like MFS transporter